MQSIEGKVRRPIVNYNEQQIARLSREDREEINLQLDQVPAVMRHFGYVRIQQ